MPSETAAVLLDSGADVHTKNKDGKMPLHLVAVRNASETAAVLLDNGADVHARDAAECYAASLGGVGKCF